MFHGAMLTELCSISMPVSWPLAFENVDLAIGGVAFVVGIGLALIALKMMEASRP